MFIINRYIESYRKDVYMSVGVMKDYKLKLRNFNLVTRLTYTGLVVELEHLKIETGLIDEKFANAMGEYVT